MNRFFSFDFGLYLRHYMEVIPGLWLINTFHEVAGGVLRTSTRPTCNILLPFRASV
jgi:hypothetical protein